jgi:protein-S-isoprenylcysteine O-methyltransferase Ste14
MKRVPRAVRLAIVAAVVFAPIGYAEGRFGWQMQLDRERLLPAFVLWVVFFVYWGMESRNKAPTERGERTWSTVVHQVVLNVALLLLFIPVPGLTGWFLPERWRGTVVVGAIVQASFLALAVWARRHLGRNWAAEVRIGVGHELVRSGPYRRLRHPIYTAMLGMFVGTAIASSQYHALLGVALLFVAYLRKTRLEEEILSQTFGDEYTAYRRGSWRLVPPLF